MSAAVLPLIYSDVEKTFGSLTLLAGGGRPNVHAVRALEVECTSRARAIQNANAPTMGYSGIFMNIGEYVMSDPTPWQDPPNPGSTPNYDPIDADGNQRFLDDNVHAQIRAKHAADLILWANCNIVQRVICTALDKAVPDIYKPNDVLGQLSFGFGNLDNHHQQLQPSQIRRCHCIHHTVHRQRIFS
jgi:hypothetical protein